MIRPLLVQTMIAGVLFVLTATAYAETVNSNADLANSKKTVAYIYSRPMVDALYRLAIEQDKKFGLQQNCKSQYGVEPYSIVVLQPIDFPDNKQHPIKGIWNFRYQIHRCGESKFYNALFIASGTGETPPTPRAYFPGTSNASPLLIKDTMVAALVRASSQSGLKDCKEIDVFDMRVTEDAHDVTEEGKTHRGVWNETWTFRLCGKMFDVPITFIPDATGGGTSFVIHSAKSTEAAAKP